MNTINRLKVFRLISGKQLLATLGIAVAATFAPVNSGEGNFFGVSGASGNGAAAYAAREVNWQGLETAYFAGGCFWGMEETFRQTKGVEKTTVGFSGGKPANPSYELVCGGKTGHAETVKVEFDPKIVSYKALLTTFFHSIDPTTVNQQGPDRGEQYRSAIFYTTEAQKAQALAALKDSQRLFSKPIVTQVVPEAKFYPAEEYHQQYLEKHGMAVCH